MLEPNAQAIWERVANNFLQDTDWQKLKKLLPGDAPTSPNRGPFYIQLNGGRILNPTYTPTIGHCASADLCYWDSMSLEAIVPPDLFFDPSLSAGSMV